MTAKKIKLMAGIFVMATIAGSCKKDFLDVFPNDALSDATVWTDLQFANRFLNNIYGTLPSGFSRADQGVVNGWARGMSMFATATDDAEANNLAASTHTVNQGVIPTTWGYAEDMWGQHYALIRKCNVMLEKIDGVQGDATMKARMKGEAQFLRAFAYEELIKSFGGVPLMLSAGTPDESIIPRSSYAQCVSQIVTDCDEAAAALPVSNTAANLGRASKAAALALKSRVLLYAASPLNNAGNETARWQTAADAARAVMAFGPPPGTGDYGLHPDYYKTFIDKVGNREILFARKFQSPSVQPSDGAREKLYMSVPGVGDGAWGGMAPTQNLVDAYEMKNGKPISDPSSGYNPQDPYTDRDSRLDKSVLHQGSRYKMGIVIETYRGGNTNNANRLDSSKTGYGLLKMVDTAKYGAAGLADNDWIFIRYAEVLLNYAEAQNEAVGPDASVYNAINQVRARSGQPALSNLSQTEMRMRIRNERRVELSFEEHRFFDVRRWKQGLLYFNAPVNKVIITRNANSTFSYGYPVWENRQFQEHQNLLPIPQTEVDRNPQLTQNPGY